MTQELILSYVNSMAPVIALLIAIFTVSGQIAKVVVSLKDRIANKSLRRRFDAILIRPTIDEIAKYSIKSDQKYRNDNPSSETPEKPEIFNDIFDSHTRQRVRLYAIAIYFILGFLVIAGKFTYLSLYEP